MQEKVFLIMPSLCRFFPSFSLTGNDNTIYPALFPYIISALDEFPPLNSFRSKNSVYQVIRLKCKSCARVRIVVKKD